MPVVQDLSQHGVSFGKTWSERKITKQATSRQKNNAETAVFLCKKIIDDYILDLTI